MSGFLGQARRCSVCRGHFQSVEAYSEHLPDCVIEHRFRERKFRQLEGMDPLIRQAMFIEGGFDESDVVTAAPFTQAERVDGGLRSGRIRRIPWVDDSPEPEPNVLRRIWRKISGRD